MKKGNILNFIWLIIFLILISIPIGTSFTLYIKQRQENKILHQKLLVLELVVKKIQEKVAEKNYLMGKFDPSQRGDFIAVPENYSISGYKMYLRKETLDAFLQMQKVAEKDEVDLRIASATRNFIYQKNIWNNKWTGFTLVDGKSLVKSILDESARFKKILEYSAVPGTSRHHWGTEIDINNANLEYFETEKGKKVYEWLVKNAPLFGFCQPYIQKGVNRPTGYNEEKWHWSYLPLAKDFTQEYKNLINDADIKDFDGDKYVPDLNLINNYVLGINLECL
ncbi:M15 family metallopeptidase [Patescibacteria group bacterium]|nr:M15 family metallopeptidase [Patescibacteria group bacterium]